MAEEDNCVIGGATATVGSDLGYLKSGDGVAVVPTVEHYHLEVESALSPVKSFRIKEAFEINFTLCEPTLANIVIACGTDNAASGTGPTVLSLGDNQVDVVEVVVAITGIVPGGDGFTRTWTFHRCILTSPPEIKFTKDEPTMLPVGFTAHYDSTETEISEISDAAS